MRAILIVVARLYAGLMLLIYGFPKLVEPSDLLKSIHTYGILPTQPPLLLNLSAVALPWLEILAGAAILLSPLRRGASTLSAVVLVVFTSAILMRTFDIMGAEGLAFTEVSFDCGCGSGEVVIWEKMIFNSSLILACIVAGFSRRKGQALTPPPAASQPSPTKA
jgi:uncharacterized membrane protein YphA (DoxX/SURF4 family)